jgi:hypothetical protein
MNHYSCMDGLLSTDGTSSIVTYTVRRAACGLVLMGKAVVQGYEDFVLPRGTGQPVLHISLAYGNRDAGGIWRGRKS